MRTLRRRPIARATAASLAALGGLWVVGSGIAGAQGRPVHHRASELASASGSAVPTSVAAAATLTLTASGHATTVSATGRVDFAHAAAGGTVVLPAVGHLITTPTALPVELVGGTVYVKVPAQFAQFLGGAAWVSVALPASVTAGLVADFHAVAIGLGNEQAVLALHTGSLTPLGTKVIGGVTATGTSGTFPVAALLGLVPGIPSSVGTRLSHLVGTAALPLDLWADAQGRLVQLSVDDRLTTKAGPVTVAATVNLTGYDDPVSIQPPPPGQVKPLPAPATGARGALGALLGGGFAGGRAAATHGTGHWSPHAHSGQSPRKVTSTAVTW